MAVHEIMELTQKSKKYEEIIEEMVRVERKVFPKHESLATSFKEELRKKNCGVLYSQMDGEVLVGYVMYSWPSSLAASITKLAGDNQIMSQRSLPQAHIR
ncbi:hypothetical protein IFM89_036498 [Coptis chinensis]|uniref:N-acetyltransferase domain-containing protein n=1 Tax=Coptis chinensis TaxID=261450 RepID=A0A835I7K4_9MAGN|nr:hypothetical protein IFM89_036498 [Coptis chinensis]